MKAIDKQTNDLQLIEKDILQRLIKILDEHSIPYFLAYGTLLGTIRHKGFIPWDDDIDIQIWVEDYEKLLKIFETEDTGTLAFHDFHTVEDYPFIFPKIVESTTILEEKRMRQYKSGIYIDIFPLIAVNDNLLIYYFESIKHYFYYAVIRLYYVEWEDNFRKLLRRFVRKFVNVSNLQQKVYNSYVKNKKKTKFVKDPYIFRRKDLLKRNNYSKPVRAIFENMEVCIPEGYEKCLEQKYGNYMELPKEEDRISRHEFAALDYQDFMRFHIKL